MSKEIKDDAVSTKKEEKYSKYLVKPIPERFMPSVVKVTAKKGKKSKFNNLNEFREHFKSLGETEGKRADNQTYNQVRVCKSKTCNKPNAVTLSNCNSCGEELPTDISKTDNILYSFVYGIKIPLSIRHQTKDYLVYDDILSLSRCHLNAIPTMSYIPDIRSLFSKPAEALAIINGLKKACVSALKPFRNKKFQLKNFGEQGARAVSLKTEEFLNEFVIYGFNCPPSQFQLHLQFIVLPHIPYQQYMHEQGRHYTHERFFPFEYVEKALLMNKPQKWDQSTKLKDVIEFFKGEGLDYDKIHKEQFDKVTKVYKKTQSYMDKDDFEGTFDPNENTYTPHEQGKLILEGAKASDFSKSDTEVLQNYGRPYTKENKKSVGFYKFAKKTLLDEF